MARYLKRIRLLAKISENLLLLLEFRVAVLVGNGPFLRNANADFIELVP
jgi:hypothetical protein